MGQSGSCDAALASSIANSTANLTANLTFYITTVNSEEDDFPHPLIWPIEDIRVITYAHHTPELICSNSVRTTIFEHPLCPACSAFRINLFFSFAEINLANFLVHCGSLLYIYRNSFDLRRGLA